MTSAESRRGFLDAMLAVAARIPDPAARDQFGDRLAHKARIAEEVVRSEIRRAAVERRPSLGEAEAARGLRLVGEVKPAERALIWALLHQPGAALGAMDELEAGDLDGLATGGILSVARSMAGFPADALPNSLLERLSTGEVQLVERIGAQTGPAAPADDCVRALKRLRYERERAEVQREIDRLQELGAAAHDAEITALWARKKDLLTRIEALSA
jgi:hypothetical protein